MGNHGFQFRKCQIQPLGRIALGYQSLSDARQSGQIAPDGDASARALLYGLKTQ